MVSCPWTPSCSCPSSAASQLKMFNAWWTPMGSSALPCSQGTPAPAPSSGPIRVIPCRWVLRGQVAEPCETPACEGRVTAALPPRIHPRCLSWSWSRWRPRRPCPCCSSMAHSGSTGHPSCSRAYPAGEGHTSTWPQDCLGTLVSSVVSAPPPSYSDAICPSRSHSKDHSLLSRASP